MPPERRLAAIMFTDIVGYTALMAESEERGLRARERHRAVLGPLAAEHHGEVVDENGDELVICFPSALDTVSCALSVQEQLRDDGELELRIGIHLGDVVFEDGRVYGDGVNVASRVRPLAEPGSVCVSDEVQHSIQNQGGLETRSLGAHELKNVSRPIEVFAVGRPGTLPASTGRSRAGRPSLRRSVPVAAGLVVVAAFLGWWLMRPASEVAPLTSIAVLPFDDMSPGGDQAWLGDGTADELIDTLSRVTGLRVVARTSSFAFKGKQIDIRTIGDQLGVGSIVEGSVRRSGDDLRITAQLIRVKDGYHIWSERYDRRLDDVFAIQEEIASAVVDGLLGALGVVRERRTPSDPRAWQLMLLGRNYHEKFTKDGLRTGISYYHRSLEIDPRHADAWAHLAWAHHQLWRFGYDPSSENLGKREIALKRALELDNQNLFAGNLRASLLAVRDHDWEAADRELRALRDRFPGQRDPFWTSGFLSLMLGRSADAILYFKRAAEVDPLTSSLRSGLGEAHLYARDYAAAIEEFELARSLGPELPYNAINLAWAYHATGLDAEAAKAVVRAHSGAEASLRAGYDQDGWIGLIRAALNWEVSQSGEPCTGDPIVGAHLLAEAGDADAMFRCLGEGLAHFGFAHVVRSPVFDPYRDDPRFTALLRRMNLAE